MHFRSLYSSKTKPMYLFSYLLEVIAMSHLYVQIFNFRKS